MTSSHAVDPSWSSKKRTFWVLLPKKTMLVNFRYAGEYDVNMSIHVFAYVESYKVSVKFDLSIVGK